MKPLAILDLMAHKKDNSRLIVDNHHRYTAPDRPLLHLKRDDDPARLLEAGAIQVTGSTDMVGDSDYVARWSAGIEAAAEAGIPVLGICFGHQMLGAHFGATLKSWPKSRLGVTDVTFQANGPFRNETIPVMLTHRDYLSDIGPNLEECGTGGYGGIQAWSHKSLPIWGLQSHPEADAPLARAMEKKNVDNVTDEVLSTPEAKGILRRFGQMMI